MCLLQPVTFHFSGCDLFRANNKQGGFFFVKQGVALLYVEKKEVKLQIEKVGMQYCNSSKLKYVNMPAVS